MPRQWLSSELRGWDNSKRSYPRGRMDDGAQGDLRSSRIRVYHCFSRCVRRAFLCGVDEYTGKNDDHRKQWIEDLLELAASCHVIDVLSFGIMDNHFHVMLRNRPDLEKKLSPTTVARRWLLLHPKRRDKNGKPCEPTRKELHEITKDKKRVAELRKRLANILWLMGFVKERVARRANAEDEVSGAFLFLRNDSECVACSATTPCWPVWSTSTSNALVLSRSAGTT